MNLTLLLHSITDASQIERISKKNIKIKVVKVRKINI